MRVDRMAIIIMFPRHLHRSLFVLFLLTIVLRALWFADSDCPFGIFKLFFILPHLVQKLFLYFKILHRQNSSKIKTRNRRDTDKIDTHIIRHMTRSLSWLDTDSSIKINSSFSEINGHATPNPNLELYT